MLLLLCSLNISAQTDLFPLQQDYIEETRSVYGNIDSIKHTSLLPFNIQNTPLEKNYFYDNENLYYSVFKAKLLKDDLLKVNEKDFVLRVNPLFNFKGGKELRDTSEYADTTLFFQNTRGFKIDGKIGRRLFFSTSFLENQAYLPGWQKAYADSFLVIPGLGRHKAHKDNGFDFAASTGWISYYPIKNLNVFFGHGKMFSGHGYRSHHLSHLSFNYPHLKTTSHLFNGKVQLMWSIAGLQSLERQPLGEVPESLFKKKSATFSSINYLLGKRTQISIVESNTWKRYDNETGSEPLATLAYIPVPMFGFLSNSDSSVQSSRIGANLLYKISNNSQFYSQYQLETDGVQIGVRVNNPFHVNGLGLLVEYNQAKGKEYSNSLIDFRHFNENIGHPINGEFEEYIVRVKYRRNRWNGSVSAVQIVEATETLTLEAIAGFLVNSKTNFNINIGYLNRHENVDNQYRSSVLYLGVSTNIVDSFFDF